MVKAGAAGALKHGALRVFGARLAAKNEVQEQNMSKTMNLPNRGFTCSKL